MKKIMPLRSFFVEKVFVFLHLGSFPLRKSIAHLSLFDIDILQHSVSDLKFSIRSIFVDIFKSLKRKNILPENMEKEVVVCLGTG